MLIDQNLEKPMYASALDALKSVSEIVADTGDVEMIAALRPKDATTNPSLVLESIKSRMDLMVKAREIAAKQKFDLNTETLPDLLTCLLTCEILELVPGYVSMEVPARLSFDTEATVSYAEKLLMVLRELGGDPKRVLIKLAASWEGIEAAKQLEIKGIKCNVTLVFSVAQAALAAQANAFLISPFVGRVLDWNVHNGFHDLESGDPDPGVEFVQCIRAYFQQHSIDTIIMAASFRHTSQVLALAGTNKLTVSPSLLTKLQHQAVPENWAGSIQPIDEGEFAKLDLSEAGFRHLMNGDAMASFLLNDGIRRFERDARRLNIIIQQNA